MKINKVIDWFGDLPMLPITSTENHSRRSVRVAGVLVYVIWFYPALLAFFLAVVILGIPAMIEDTWE